LSATLSLHTGFMRQALTLARLGEGLTRPNPPVGAVIVKHGKVIGQGSHRRAGGLHAELIALKQAGIQARGATLYVTLEPCSTHGRTPPCTEAILQNGIRHLVISVIDPNPCHAGNGIRMLKRKGITITQGICKDEGEALIQPFAKWIRTGRPYLTLKLAMSVDGRIADKRGCSQWITGKQARAEAHALRRRADGILVGLNTVLKDDPSLFPRPRKGRNIHRIVVDSKGRIPLSSQLLNDGHEFSTLVVTTKAISKTACKRILAKGADVQEVHAKAGKVSLHKLMDALGRKGLLHIVCEGGGELAGALMQENLVDECVFFLAPRILGGQRAVPGINGPGWLLGKGPELIFYEVRMVGNDLMIKARLRNSTPDS